MIPDEEQGALYCQESAPVANLRHTLLTEPSHKDRLSAVIPL